MKILFLSRWFPFPFDNGSKLRIYNILRGLSQQNDVTLLSFADQPEVSLEAVEERSICSDVHVVPWREFNPASMCAILGFLSLKPRSHIDTFSPAMVDKITQLLNDQKFDLVIVSQLPMAMYYPYFKHVPAIFEELEIGLGLENSRYAVDWRKRLRHALTRYKFRRYLMQLLKSFRAVTVVSHKEKELVQRNFPNVKDILVFPNCMNVDDYQDIRVEPRPNTLIFTGSFRYHTNYEAMIWFVRDVFPLILNQVPNAQLIITGDHADLPLPSNRNVILAGYVDDIKGLIASAAVSIAPLWSGGGTRLKILESMAVGTPVVATTKGAEGLDAQNGKHLFIADEPEKFSEIVIRIFSEKKLRHRLSVNAKQLVKEKYNWSGVMPDFLKLVEKIDRT